MIIRLSQKLNEKIGAGPLPAVPLDENPFADWTAHLFKVDRAQYIILSNTKSLYSTVLFAKGITNDSLFIQHALSGIREFMEGDGLQIFYRRFIVPATGTIQFAKTSNRSVTGSMNDLVNHATAMLVRGEVSPYSVGFELNDVFLSAIAPNKAAKYGKPREAFTAMAASP